MIDHNPKTPSSKSSSEGKVKTRSLANQFARAFESALPADPYCREAGRAMATAADVPGLIPADIPDLLRAWEWCGWDYEPTAKAVAGQRVKLWRWAKSMRAGKPRPTRRGRGMDIDELFRIGDVEEEAIHVL